MEKTVFSETDSRRKLLAFASNDWIRVLIREYELEVRVEARWPTLLLNSTERRKVWAITSVLRVRGKGVPGCACRLLERYLSTHVRTFLQETRSAEEWLRYKDDVLSRFYLLAVSCVQLAAKMSDMQAQLNASTVRSMLLHADIDYSTFEIVAMEIHVYYFLGYRIPLWNSLEIAEYLAVRMGLTEPRVLNAVGHIVNLTEYHRDVLERHMKHWLWQRSSDTSATPPRGNKMTLHNLHVCAGVVVATARYMRCVAHDLVVKLSRLLRVESCYIKAMANTILLHVLSEDIPILKKRRLI